MSDNIESRGKSVEEAVAEALLRLGARRDEVDVEVLEEAKPALWGLLGGRPARVRVTRKAGARAAGAADRLPADQPPVDRAAADRPAGGGQGRRERGRPERERGPQGAVREERPQQRARDGSRRDAPPGQGRRGGGRGADGSGGGARREGPEGRDAREGRGNREGSGNRESRDAREGGREGQRRSGGRGGARQGPRPAAAEEGRGERQREEAARTAPRREESRGRPLHERFRDEDMRLPGERPPEYPPVEPAASTAPASWDLPAEEAQLAPAAPAAAATRPAPGDETPPNAVPDVLPGEEVVAAERIKPLRNVTAEAIPAALVQITSDLMTRAGFPCRCEVKPGDYHLVKVTTDESSAAVLIGRHGATVDALEHLVERMAAQAAGGPVHLNLDVNNYRRRREERLVQRAQQAIDKVRQTGQEQHFEPLSARERRIIHLEVAKAGGLQTFTIFDGAGKHVVVARGDAAVPSEARPEPAGGPEDDGDAGLRDPGGELERGNARPAPAAPEEDGHKPGAEDSDEGRAGV